MSLKLYKDTNNEVYSFPVDGSQDSLIGDKTPITQEEADAITEANFAPIREKILKTMDYSQLRLMEYPPIGDQLDAVWKGGEAAAEMNAKIKAIKAKFPKPESF